VLFRDILHDALEATHGAIGAVFLDAEGESVEVVTERPFETDDHDLRVIGAYAGIFFSQLRRIAEAIGDGEVVRYKIDFAASRVFCRNLHDGYYLVMIVDAGAIEGSVWREVELCREALLQEMS
jgi:predicted regulator of Ras-like GTPase activity (Roadblock/LC7/MglB family)